MDRKADLQEWVECCYQIEKRGFSERSCWAGLFAFLPLLRLVQSWSSLDANRETDPGCCSDRIPVTLVIFSPARSARICTCGTQHIERYSQGRNWVALVGTRETAKISSKFPPFWSFMRARRGVVLPMDTDSKSHRTADQGHLS